MQKIVAAILIACALFSLSYAAESVGQWTSLRQARYLIFSGYSLADSEPPTAKDRKLSIIIEGQPAKEIFDSIGPDATEMCSSEKGDRERDKGGVQCSYSAKDAKKPGKGYRCWIGINLLNGQSTPTVPC